jgi:hypothetical protein
MQIFCDKYIKKITRRVSQHYLVNKFFSENKNLNDILHGVDVTFTYHGL